MRQMPINQSILLQSQRIKKLSITLLFIGLLILTATSWALSSDSQKPYQVKANGVIYNRHKHQTTYTGNVTASQGSTRVQGDKVVIISSATTNKVIEIIAYGKQAHYSTLPDNHQQRLVAQANTIKYWPQHGKVLLIDEGRISQKHNEFSGALIWYDTNKQTVLSGSNQSSRTRIVIEPSSTSGSTSS